MRVGLAAVVLAFVLMGTREVAWCGSGEGSSRVVFVKPVLGRALFSHEETALLQVECERVAGWLARRAAVDLTLGVLGGSGAAVERGRRMLALAMHLDPANVLVARVADRWGDGKDPELAGPDENLRVFTDFLVRVSERKAANPEAAGRQALLARFLVRLAADVDPGNEEAVYRSERQDREGQGPPWKSLLAGRLGGGRSRR